MATKLKTRKPCIAMARGRACEEAADSKGCNGALRANAKRQRRYRANQIDLGRVLVKAWLSFEAKQNLLALAGKCRVTIEQAVEIAVDESWQTAGKP